jgi:hypothetical protein
MNREQSAFLLGGVVFGIVTGLILGFVFFKPGVIGDPPVNLQGGAPVSASEGMAAQQGGGGAAPATGGMDPGATMGKVMQEVQNLKSVLDKDPNNLDALVRLGDMYFEVGKYDESQKFYSKAVSLDPRNPEVHTALALCLLNMGQAAQSLKECQSAMTLKPDYWPAVAYSIIAAVQVGDRAVATESLARLKQLNPSFDHMKDFEDQVAKMGSAASPAGS